MALEYIYFISKLWCSRLDCSSPSKRPARPLILVLTPKTSFPYDLIGPHLKSHKPWFRFSTNSGIVAWKFPQTRFHTDHKFSFSIRSSVYETWTVYICNTFMLSKWRGWIRLIKYIEISRAYAFTYSVLYHRTHNQGQATEDTEERIGIDREKDYYPQSDTRMFFVYTPTNRVLLRIRYTGIWDAP